MRRADAECAIAVERRWSCDKTETRFHDAWVRCVSDGKVLRGIDPVVRQFIDGTADGALPVW